MSDLVVIGRLVVDYDRAAVALLRAPRPAPDQPEWPPPVAEVSVSDLERIREGLAKL